MYLIWYIFKCSTMYLIRYMFACSTIWGVFTDFQGRIFRGSKVHTEVLLLVYRPVCLEPGYMDLYV